METWLGFLEELLNAPEGKIAIVITVIIVVGLLSVFIGMLAVGRKMAQALQDSVKGQASNSSVLTDPESPIFALTTGLVAANTKLSETLERMRESTDALVEQTTVTKDMMGIQAKTLEAIVDFLKIHDNNTRVVMSAVTRIEEGHVTRDEDVSNMLSTLAENQAVMQQAVEKLVVMVENLHPSVVRALESLDTQMCQTLAKIEQIRDMVNK